jgi:hypothetical protein
MNDELVDKQDDPANVCAVRDDEAQMTAFLSGSRGGEPRAESQSGR